MTTPDETTPTEEHYNPATGYIETTATEDDAQPSDTSATPLDDGEHYNPATGYIETSATED